MALPPFQKLNTPDSAFSRGQDNAAEPWRVLLTKQLLISGETALFLERTVTVPSDWTAVSVFANSWVNYDTATNPGAQYRMAVDGMVEIYGVIRSGTVGSAAFTLPAAYRPAQRVNFACVANSLFGLVYVDNNGEVVPAVGTNTYFDFGLFRFAAADRAPVPASCWPVQIPCSLKARPTGVFMAEARETGNNAYVAAAHPDWDWESIQGQNFVIIRNVPLLPPDATYDLTFLVTGEQ